MNSKEQGGFDAMLAVLMLALACTVGLGSLGMLGLALVKGAQALLRIVGL